VRLTKSEYIFRIENGLYCIRNFQNPYVIANAMLKGSALAYWTALNIHGLTEQISNVVFSQSTHLKNDKKVFNVHYKFVKVKPGKMFGTMQMGYDNETFHVTDIEKTHLRKLSVVLLL
jgi:predicted transcriptional regulator of viral defense system